MISQQQFCSHNARAASSAARNPRLLPTHTVLRLRSAADARLATAKATAAADSSVTSASLASAWPQFAANVSGEWEGVTASFSPAGAPQQLPEHYVPEAFREWGVELWDWQSQCSCLADAADEQRLKSVVRRLMPTVGCEADAIAFTEEEGSSGSSGSSSSGASVDAAGSSSGQAMLFAADGSYNSGPAALPPTGKDDGPSKFQVEHCFALPAPAHTSSSSSSPAPTASRYRLKVVQQFRRDWSTGAWVLDCVDLHRERYDGPYTGKRELAGCGGGQPGIAQLPVLQQQDLAGTWGTVQESSVTTSSSDSQLGRLSCLDDAAAAPSEGGAVQLTLLPLGAWSAVQLSTAGQLQRAEAGVLLGLHAQQQLLKGDAAEGAGGGDGGSTSSRLVSCRVYDAAGAGSLHTAVLGQDSRQ